MNNPFRRRRASGTILRSAPNDDDHAEADPADFHPADHQPLAPEFDRAEMLTTIEAKIAHLASRGSLDGGHADVLDRWIEKRRREHEHRIHQHASRRRQTAASLRSTADRNAAVIDRELRRARRDHLQNERDRAWWRDVLLGTAEGPPPATVLSDDPDVLVAPEVPDSTPHPDLSLSDLEYGDD